MHLKMSEGDVDKSNSADSTDEPLKENMVQHCMSVSVKSFLT